MQPTPRRAERRPPTPPFRASIPTPPIRASDPIPSFRASVPTPSFRASAAETRNLCRTRQRSRKTLVPCQTRSRLKAGMTGGLGRDDGRGGGGHRRMEGIRDSNHHGINGARIYHEPLAPHTLSFRARAPCSAIPGKRTHSANPGKRPHSVIPGKRSGDPESMSD